MALFGKLFEKKQCSICGGEIGLLGNRKLEDGNMCKDCSAKLSPWFSDRRSSTIAQIQEQLAYREANKEKVASFNTTRTLGRNTKVLLDEDAQKFMVTSASNLASANPDVLDFSQVTGVDIDINESRSEDKKKDAEGKLVSYVPPRYFYSYNFRLIIHVNHPYFDEMSFQLNPSAIKVNPEQALPLTRKPNQLINNDYIEYDELAKEIKTTLTTARQRIRDEVAAAAAPKIAVTCPWCGATTMETANGTCEYCGGSLKG